ncbi:copper chaperone PCu(A)C [Paracoccaceae bacterium Fryx2]|nr:copper chaperone PCu(A)C [Paracoccaceae bacterium Fryx2]
MTRSLSLLAALLLCSAAVAHENTVGDLQIIHASIPAPTNSARSAAGYMAISNEGTAADRLIGVEVDFAAQAMLHTTEFGSDGVARMMHLDALEIPADETVMLEPGGHHIMLMGLNRTLEPGAMLPATLIFEQAGRVEMEFMVDPAAHGGDHSTMDHSAHGAATTTAP